MGPNGEGNPADDDALLFRICIVNVRIDREVVAHRTLHEVVKEVPLVLRKRAEDTGYARRGFDVRKNSLEPGNSIAKTSAR